MKQAALASALALTLATVQVHETLASEITVLSVPPLRASFEVIAPEFERAAGHKISITYAPSSSLKERIEAGEAFDLVVTFPGHVDQLIQQGKVVPGSRVDLARSGIGIAIKKGTAKRDIGSTEALKIALLEANSIAYAAEGPSGVHIMRVLERLGIATEVKPKLKPMPAGSAVLAPVAKGEVEIGVVSVPFILAEPQVELTGAFPEELQDHVVFSSGGSAVAKNAQAAKSLLDFLRQPAPAATLRSKGLEPISHP